jgi:hypothetical protein
MKLNKYIYSPRVVKGLYILSYERYKRIKKTVLDSFADTKHTSQRKINRTADFKEMHNIFKNIIAKKHSERYIVSSYSLFNKNNQFSLRYCAVFF